jgi:replication initiation protein RepC
MAKQSAQAAPGESRVGRPTGLRRLTPGLLQADRAAEGFCGLPDGISMPGQLLAALKAAAPRLGLSPRLVHAVDWLFRFTQPQDWGRGGRPIVWPSAATQRDALGLSATQAKALNRALIEAGLVTMKDSPNGKRYGHRDGQGRIVEAYGFDLAPIAARHAEFARLAAEARAERAELARLRRRATIARNGIVQILETAAEYAFAGEEWTDLARDTQRLARALRQAERPEAMALGVESLERRQRAARERLETLLLQAPATVPKPEDSAPLGSENRPHHSTYNSSPDPEQDTVTAPEVRKSSSDRTEATQARPVPPQRQPPGHTGKSSRTNGCPVPRLSTDELVQLAPRLRPYLQASAPSWSDIVDAAGWLRHDLGVSQSLWGEACVAMGREQAAIALAIVSAKPDGHFTASPGGYFYGMVAKAKAGELNLGRTVWGLRTAGLASGKGPAPRCAEGAKPVLS